MTVRIGIDTGGTFTDLIGIDEATDQLVIAKTPSTPRRPAQAVINAIKSCGVPGDSDLRPEHRHDRRDQRAPAAPGRERHLRHDRGASRTSPISSG